MNRIAVQLLNYHKMKTNTFILFIFIFLTPGCTSQKKGDMKNSSVYNVSKLNSSMLIDGNWNKSEWQNIKALILKIRWVISLYLLQQFRQE